MTNCPSCQHPRLVHDSWGCKLQCSCGVSIVYLTPLLPSQPDRVTEDKLIEHGNALVLEIERRRELEVEELHRRAVLELAPPPAVPEELLQ